MATILLTGASSFSGLWIAEALAARGHAVIVPLRRARQDYEGIARDRVERLHAIAEVVEAAPLASESFRALVAERRPQVLAHHAAEIAGYRDPDYDVVAGFVRNSADARSIVEAFAEAGGQAVIKTGTAFEVGEGGAAPDELAVNRYGLSQTLTSQTWRHAARWAGLAHGRFVIAGPFGVYEQGRLVWSLFQRWLAGQPGLVRTPAYVRDNLPAPLLGAAYADLAERLLAGDAPDLAARPSGFVGPQGEFARLVAREAGARLGRPCIVQEAVQTEFPEPRVRANSELCLNADWDGAAFWDSYVDYYLSLEARGLLALPA